MEDKHRMVAGFNTTFAFLRGHIAARGDANRRHVVENTKAITSAIKDDLTDGTPHEGAMTESMLTAFGELTALLCERAVGPDPRKQLNWLESVITKLGQTVERNDRS